MIMDSHCIRRVKCHYNIRKYDIFFNIPIGMGTFVKHVTN